MARLLEDPQIGGFQVRLLLNATNAQILREMVAFLKNRSRDDLLLLYYSGHGIVDDAGRLFLAACDTDKDLLAATAVSSSFLKEELDRSRSKRQVLILDCCHSGAFLRGAKGAALALTQNTFEGYGRAVLTASDSVQYALEGDQALEGLTLSLFTHFLAEGLETGDADLGDDGLVELDEWFDYAYRKVRDHTDQQTPRKFVHDQYGELYIARSARPPKPAELPEKLRAHLISEWKPDRLDAVKALAVLLKNDDTALVQAARLALEDVVEHDDSQAVRRAAAAALGLPPPAPPVVAAPTPEVAALPSSKTATPIEFRTLQGEPDAAGIPEPAPVFRAAAISTEAGFRLAKIQNVLRATHRATGEAFHQAVPSAAGERSRFFTGLGRCDGFRRPVCFRFPGTAHLYSIICRRGPLITAVLIGLILLLPVSERFSPARRVLGWATTGIALSAGFLVVIFWKSNLSALTQPLVGMTLALIASAIQLAALYRRQHPGLAKTAVWLVWNAAGGVVAALVLGNVYSLPNRWMGSTITWTIYCAIFGIANGAGLAGLFKALPAAPIEAAEPTGRQSIGGQAQLAALIQPPLALAMALQAATILVKSFSAFFLEKQMDVWFGYPLVAGLLALIYLRFTGQKRGSPLSLSTMGLGLVLGGVIYLGFYFLHTPLAMSVSLFGRYWFTMAFGFVVGAGLVIVQAFSLRRHLKTAIYLILLWAILLIGVGGLAGLAVDPISRTNESLLVTQAAWGLLFGVLDAASIRGLEALSKRSREKHIPT